jgi:DHA3 family multidrug efflux protein-like MFS transporter
MLWVFVVVLMIGTVTGNMRTIALSTAVTLLFPEAVRDKANGLVGTMQGISFAATSVFSGIVIGFFGMEYALTLALIVTAIALMHILSISFPETVVSHDDEKKRLDIRGTIAVIVAIPGLIALIVFNTFNNLLGGVFMALMDVYGLSLMSVQNWGFLWGVMSLCMIGGGIYVATYGVGKNPLRTIMLLNIVIWVSCLIFPLQASIPLLIFGMVVWMSSFPIIEAAEQTVIQNIVPPKRQGRVFGFAQSIESAASPVTAFLIGPLAAVFFIPFMTTGFGVELIGNWFGTSESRGIALVFITAGFVGLIVTLLAWMSRPYRLLSDHYQKQITTQ